MLKTGTVLAAALSYTAIYFLLASGWVAFLIAVLLIGVYGPVMTHALRAERSLWLRAMWWAALGIASVGPAVIHALLLAG
jgi:hypothetical protein